MANLRPASTNYIVSKFPWGCSMIVDPETKWPVHRVITHDKATCQCKAKGGDHDLIRDTLFVVAYEYYYQKDRVKYDAVACNELVLGQIDRLGLDIEDLDFWSWYPDCLPPRHSS
ncbi:hypothetical protein F4861DRAFT_199724 [Xylaria intraflava]|nr:hypothetical protein F4861DRAFT_199724 [Xylaria intraflava]